MVIHLLMVEIIFRYYGNTIRTKFSCIFLGVFGPFVAVFGPFAIKFCPYDNSEQ
jgi:hypothetical protein